MSRFDGQSLMGEHREALAHDWHRVGIAKKPAHYWSGFFSAAFASSTHGQVWMGELVQRALRWLTQPGTVDMAFTSVCLTAQIAYEQADPGAGWFRGLHDHLHISMNF